MDKRYYKQYYHFEREHWWFVVRSDIICDRLDVLLEGKEDLQILNIGAATFRSSEYLSRYGTVTSLEFDEDCCDFVRDVLNKDVIQGSILELPFEENQFDLVCAFDVIEHVEDDTKAAEEMKRVCNSQGHLFITVPAYNFLWSDHDRINHHIRRYTRSKLQSLLKSNKINTVRSTYFNFILFLPIFLVRILSNMKKSQTLSSDFEKFRPGSLGNRLCKIIFSLERVLLKWMGLPFGVSILHIQKND